MFSKNIREKKNIYSYQTEIFFKGKNFHKDAVEWI